MRSIWYTLVKPLPYVKQRCKVSSITILNSTLNFSRKQFAIIWKITSESYCTHTKRIHEHYLTPLSLCSQELLWIFVDRFIFVISVLSFKVNLVYCIASKLFVCIFIWRRRKRIRREKKNTKKTIWKFSMTHF